MDYNRTECWMCRNSYIEWGLKGGLRCKHTDEDVNGYYAPDCPYFVGIREKKDEADNDVQGHV